MRELVATLYMFVEKYMYWLRVPHISAIDIVEIVIIAILLYYLMIWIKNTRAWTLFKGILIILLFLLIAAIFQMTTILWLFGKLLNFGVIALIIIFQPELRQALERLGRNNLFTFFLNFDFSTKSTEERFSEHTINEMVRACFEMSRARTGALIVLERSVVLDEYVRTGILLDASISRQLLLNIFEHNTPLHDGAIIVRDNRIVAATCYLPLSDNMHLSKELGTRHRAGVGISEVSDAITLIVSEETGAVSITTDGKILRNLDENTVKEHLIRASGGSGQKRRFFRKHFRRSRDIEEIHEDIHK